MTDQPDYYDDQDQLITKKASYLVDNLGGFKDDLEEKAGKGALIAHGYFPAPKVMCLCIC